MKPKKEGPEVNLSVRLFGEEAARWLEMYELARRRNFTLQKTEIIKRLLGLPSEAEKALTKEDIHYFQTGEKTASLGKTSQGKHSVEVSNAGNEISRQKKKRV